MIGKDAAGTKIRRTVPLIAGAVSIALLATACAGSAGAERNAAADADPVVIAALPSSAPANGLQNGGGGLAGAAYAVPGMPGALGPADKGLDVRYSEQVSIGGTRAKLTAQPGSSSYRFVVAEAGEKADGPTRWDSGEAASNPNCSIPSSNRAPKKAVKSLRSVPGSVYCIVPAGSLRNGVNYVVTTTTVTNGATHAERRLFTVTDMPDVSGSNVLSVKNREVVSPVANGGISLSFTTADQGVTPDSAAVNGFRAGLPTGWSWIGMPSGLSKATLGPANGYQNYTDFLTLQTAGSSTVLGCKTTSIGKQCDPLAGSAAGVGYTATIPTGATTIVVTNQSNGANWEFDTRGRLTTYNEPGHAPFQVSYKGDTEQIGSVQVAGMSWNFYYGADKQCNDSGRAPGFVAAPDNLICVLEHPFDQWTKFDYTQPQGAGQARLSRATGAPQSCEFALADCDWQEIQIFDIGWDEHNRPAYVRDQITSQAIMAGSLVAGTDPTTDPTLQRIQYDELGRIRTQNLAALTGSGVRQVQTLDYKEFDKVDQAYQPATHQTTTTATQSDNSTKPLTAVQAFDDRLRPMFKKEPDGSLTQVVWNPTQNLQYGAVQGNGVNATEFDKTGIMVANYSGQGSAFDLTKCSPKASADVLKNNPCLPTNVNQVVSSKVSYGDAANIGNGLISSWYANSTFTGNPVATNVGNYDGGFSMDLPQGVDGKNWSVRMRGALALKREEYSIKVAVPDHDIKGTIFFGSSFCAVIDGQVGSCTYDNSTDNKDATGLPIGFTISLSRNSGAAYTPGKVQVTLAPEDGKREPTTNQHFVQRAYTATKQDTRDPLPDGNGANTGSLSYSYGDPLAGSATKVEGSSLSGDGGGKWQQQAASTQFEPAPFGGARIKKIVASLGSTYTYEYWGIDETPAGSGLTNLGQVPDEVKDIPQLGAVKSITDPSGRVTTQIRDQYGDIACTRFSNVSGVNSGDWGCTWKDQMGRRSKTVSVSNDGHPAIETTYQNELVRTPGERYLTVTAVTKSAGKPDQTIVQTVNTTQKVVEYQDSIGTRGRYTMNAMGNVTDEEVTAAPVGGKKAVPVTIHSNYDDYGFETDTSIGGTVLSRSKWESAGAGNGRRLASVEYPGYAMKLDQRYDSGGQLTGQTWTLRSGEKINDEISTTLGQTLITTQFAGEKAEYDYAGGSVLQRATIAGTDFSYGYDQEGRRICAAVAIANPGSTPAQCSQLPGHYEYTYANDRVASTTNPKATVAPDSWDSYGNYRKIGNMSLEYDAAAQLTKATTPDGGILEMKRDMGSRVVEQTMNSAGQSVSLSTAQWKQAKALLAKQRKRGANQAEVLDSYIAGIAAKTSATPSEPVRKAAESEPAAAQPIEAGSAAASPAPAQTAESAASPSQSSEEATEATEATQTPQTTQPSSPTSSASESLSSAAPPLASQAPAADAKSTQTIRLGYTSSSGSARVLYLDNGAAIMHTLAGGLQIEGTSLTIPSLSGIGKLRIDRDGARGDRAPEFNGPYGERIGDTNPGMADLPGSRLSLAGVRTYSRDLGVFVQPDPKVAPGASQYSYGSGDPVNYSDPTGTSSFKDWIKNVLGIGGGTGMSSFWATLTSIGMGVATGVVIAGAYVGLLQFDYFALNKVGSTAIAMGVFSLIGFGMSAATEAIVSYGHVSWQSSWTWSFNGICASVTGFAGGVGFKIERWYTLGKKGLEEVATEVTATVQRGAQALEQVPASLGQMREQISAEIKQATNSVAQSIKEEIAPVVKQGAATATKGAIGATVGWAVGGMVGQAFENFTGFPIKPIMQVAGSGIGGYIGANFKPLVTKAWSYVRESRLGRLTGFSPWARSGIMGEGVMQEVRVLPNIVERTIPPMDPYHYLDDVVIEFKF